MVEIGQHLQDAAHDLALLFNRLIGVGIGANGDDLGDIATRRQLRGQQARRIGAGDQLRFEIQPRRQAQIGMAGAGKAIDAAMFAAPIRVDRLLKTQIGRGVGRNHPARHLIADMGAQRGQFLVPVPAIRLGHTVKPFEPIGGITGRGATRALIFQDGQGI